MCILSCITRYAFGLWVVSYINTRGFNQSMQLIKCFTPSNLQSRYVPWEPHTNWDGIFLCILPYLNIIEFLLLHMCQWSCCSFVPSYDMQCYFFTGLWSSFTLTHFPVAYCSQQSRGEQLWCFEAIMIVEHHISRS